MTKDVWKFEWRPDQTDTLKEILAYVISEYNSEINRKIGNEFDRVAKRICKQRIVEILNEIEDVTG